MGVWYCTREDVKSALDFNETARNNVQVDRAIESASRSIEGLLHRKFYPWTGTRYFDWPNSQYSYVYRLWLDQNELISVTSVTSGGTAITDYFLEPANQGPPFTHLELDLSQNASFGQGSTHQRDITITGVWGYDITTTPAGSAAEAIDATETAVDVSTSTVGVGDMILVDAEWMIVTGKTQLDTGQNLQSAVTAAKNDTTISVTTGSSYTVGEVILLDAEKMMIVDIAGNNLIVVRAWDGSVLAAHTSSDIYAPRTLTVTRGALGTTATTHTISTPISRLLIPGTVRALCVAEAVSTIQNETSGYARTAGSGENAQEAAQRALRDLREQTYNAYGRGSRMRAV